MRVRNKRFSTQQQDLDPVALSLALWLGLVASIGGIARLSEAAGVQAALMELNSPRAASATQDIPVPTIAAWSMAYGG